MSMLGLGLLRLDSATGVMCHPTCPPPIHPALAWWSSRKHACSLSSSTSPGMEQIGCVAVCLLVIPA